ncbi:hypothetical protein SAMN05216353_102229 [Halobacillus alkaliphilus]|uniref:Uncharacterized protein n=1 Tax=Halobacillus alkaliphilus TaxID=396056 RepID=A0A1I2JX43_9BACI|nr:hypothetical protein [Halobacillus alkaliphilus]SFF59094.1 hypothetical protein SAMN05216353_102229 [Halobacillus alkaliphilus]
MKNVTIKQILYNEDHNEVEFSKGLLLIDDVGPLVNWTVSLNKVEDVSFFEDLQKEGKHLQLHIIGAEGQTYQGTAAVDLIPDQRTVLMVARDELKQV